MSSSDSCGEMDNLIQVNYLSNPVRRGSFLKREMIAKDDAGIYYQLNRQWDEIQPPCSVLWRRKVRHFDR